MTLCPCLFQSACIMIIKNMKSEVTMATFISHVFLLILRLNKLQKKMKLIKYKC